MIDALYRLPAPDGALLLLARLYDDVEDQTAVAAWEGGKIDLPPFCWRLAGGDYKPLQDALDRGRSAITSHLAVLTKLGVIRRAKREGRSGWELLGTRRSSPATSGDPDGPVRGSGRSGPKILTATSAEPDVEPARDVRPPGPPGPPGRTSASGSPDAARAREGINQEHQAGRGGAANDRPVQAAPTSATATPSRTTAAVRTTLPVREPERPRPAPPQGPARAQLLGLARELDGMFLPRNELGEVLESRRICRGGTTADADTLRRLTELLTPPDGADPAGWLERQLAMVRGYVRDYATICEGDPKQAHEWGSYMLETRLLKSTRSAWETLTRIVDRWRETQAAATVAAREAAAEARAIEARAVAERIADLEYLARHGEPAFARELRAAGQAAPPRRDHAADHAAARAAVAAARATGREPTLAEVNAAVAAVPALGHGPADTIADFLDSPPPTSGVTPLLPLPPMQHVGEPVRELSDDEEAEIRERGRQREADAVDDERPVGELINEAIRRFRQLAGRAPTESEANEIRRRFCGEEATGT